MGCASLAVSTRWNGTGPDDGQQAKVGTLPKDKMVGKFVTEWTSYVAEAGVDMKEVDAGPGVSALLAVKDDEELVRSPFPQDRVRG